MSMDQVEPSGSSKRELDVIEDVDDITLKLNSDEEEIVKLESQIKTKGDDTNTVEDDERIARVRFHCSSCGMNEMVHYFGQKPPFVYGLKFIEDTFVMRDPFQAPPPRLKSKAEYFVAIGANCSQCQKPVCKDNQCSFYYTFTYCLNCATNLLKTFPTEVQVKLKKQMARM